MSSVTIPRTLATGFVIVAIAVVLVVGRGPAIDEGLAPPEHAIPTPSEGTPVAATASSTAARETPAAVKIRELNEMSETYRNTTFLIAIRESGFVCNELLRVYGALDDAPKWLASCSEMLSYTVSVASDGALHVEPMMQYFDGPVQRIQLEVDPSRPPQQLPPLQPPQRLR